MAFGMIERARDAWLAREDCPVTSLLAGMERKGKLRDAQLGAIKTYLFLKCACGNRPLWELYAEGAFNTYDLAPLSLSQYARDAMLADPGLAAMYEYLDDVEIDAKPFMQALASDCRSVDARAFFKKLLYGVEYSDYLFSLPMGAGKTFLMAAFIYLDLYFSATDPGNPAFARNFVVFAPSGLKSSVVPSLKTIRAFDPSWLFSDDLARRLRSLLKFEVLDDASAARRSNRVQNPNAQKVSLHLAQPSATGVVFVTNAEKVILDRVVVDEGGELVLGACPDGRATVANELRELIGRMPALAVFIDEVHHAQDDDIKLRAVVNEWVREGRDVRGVLGFSGTPYLPRKKKVEVAGGFGFKTGTLANVVYYCSLVRGIGNYLKRPHVEIVSGESSDIVRRGVDRFLDVYGERIFANGACAKLAIFCGSVQRLEEEVAPLVDALLAERGIDSAEAVLKYHRGGAGKKKYPVSKAWQTEFAMLDSPLSRKRIVLLAQIGKEGWDCKSLTGVILSQEGDCKKNMVLQTACRCLREVESAHDETALIVLNRQNARLLETQLEQTQRTDLAAFQTGGSLPAVRRSSRLDVLDIPPIAYHAQGLVRKVSTEVLDDDAVECELRGTVERFTMEIAAEGVDDFAFDEVRTYSHVAKGAGVLPCSFARWLRLLVHEGGAAPHRLKEYAASEKGRSCLHAVYAEATEPCDDRGADASRILRSDVDQQGLRAAVRTLFYERTDLSYSIEDIGEVHALTVDESKLHDVVGIERPRFYPSEKVEKEILAADGGAVSESMLEAVRTLRSIGQDEAADALLREKRGAYPEGSHADATYQYIPYRFDSPFEENFYKLLVGMEDMDSRGLEVYYNGDRTVADFRIACFEERGGSWRKIGVYTPDFLVVQRSGGTIGKTLIIETKGAGFEGEERFRARRRYIEETFLPLNNAVPGQGSFFYELFSDDKDMSDVRTRLSKVLGRVFSYDEE